MVQVVDRTDFGKPVVRPKVPAAESNSGAGLVGDFGKFCAFAIDPGGRFGVKGVMPRNRAERLLTETRYTLFSFIRNANARRDVVRAREIRA